MKLWLDTETRSPTPIKHGTAKYAELAEVILLAWAIDDEPPAVIDLLANETFPTRLVEALHHADEVWFQNSWFDWNVIEAEGGVLAWVGMLVPPERRRDTMIQAYLHSLPGALEAMCAALGVADEKAKDKRGRALIQRFCVPNKKGEFNRPEDFPEDWAVFRDEYAPSDIIAMRECHRKMPKWNLTEKQQRLWMLDQRINRRGIAMDLDLARMAVEVSEKAKRRLAKRTQEITDDAVQAATQRDVMIAHILETYGVTLPDMAAATIERRLKDEELPEELRELLRVRLESVTTSVSKFTTLLRSASSDGRLRGTMQFRGAQRTGRVAHRLFQTGNMPRPTLPKWLIEIAVDAIKGDYVDLIFDNVMEACSNCIRGSIIPGPGKKIVVADLANIEGRFAAWLAGEEWKLQAFRDYDTGEGHDLYILAYARSFGVDPADVPAKGDERQIGKVEELMLQYGGGVGAFITGAATYSIDLVQMAEQVYESLPAWAVEEAEKFLRWLYEDAQAQHDKEMQALQAQDDPLLGGISVEEFDAKLRAAADKLERRKLKARHMLTEKVFVTCDAIKRMWRHEHPEIVSYWSELEQTIRYCIANPGEVCPARKLKMKVSGKWLRIGLPSGRELCYPGIGIDVVEVDKTTGKTRKYPGISYLGQNQYTRQWSRISTYGGKVFENVTQAGSCDQLLEPGEAIEEAGFDPVLSVHDEWIAEAPADRDDLNAELLGEMMCAGLGWNEGLPLAAAGYETTDRYRKD